MRYGVVGRSLSSVCATTFRTRPRVRQGIVYRMAGGPVGKVPQVTYDATVDRILQRVVPGLPVERSILEGLVRQGPRPETLVGLLSASDPAVVRAAVLYLGLYGTLRDAPVLALCLHHDDPGVVKLAEHCAWALWLRGGSAEGNRTLATAIDEIREGRCAAAVRRLRLLLDREPAFAEAHFQCGLALCSLDRPADATRCFREALRLNPYHFGAAASLGHACVERGDLTGAARWYRVALRIHPRMENVPAALREVEAILGPPSDDGG